MNGMSPLNMHAGAFPPKKHGFLGLTPVSSDITALRKSYFKFRLQIVAKHLSLSHNSYCTGYYGIETPLPDIISKPRHLGLLLHAACWLSRATGSEWININTKEATTTWRKLR